MAVLIIIGVGFAAVAALGAGVYMATTRPCENGFHRYRHLRYRRFRPGGCSAVD